MTTTPFYDAEKIAALASSGDAFWRGAKWILDQQEAAFTMARQSDAMGRALDAATTRRASFMSDKISMDEAREKVREDYDQEWTPVSNDVAPVLAMIDDLAGKFTRNAADLGSPRIP